MKNEKLQKVSLYSNQLEVLPSNLFQNNLLLEILSLQKNSLSVVDESIFSTNNKLKYVDLSSNQLEILHWNYSKIILCWRLFFSKKIPSK